MDLIRIRSQGRAKQLYRHGAARLGLGLATLAIVSAAALAPATSAAPEPGTPVAVAPGVPGNGRSWELVTPADVVASQLINLTALSADGNRMYYLTGGPNPGAPVGGPVAPGTLATRGSNGWVNAPREAPLPESADLGRLGPEALNEEMSALIWTALLPPENGSSHYGLFREAPAGEFTLLADIGNAGLFAGSSADLEHVVVTSEEHLLAADSTRVSGQSVYEFVGSSPRLVDVDGAGALLSDCGSTVPSADAVSRDGRRIYFVTSPSCSGPTRVFLSADGAPATEVSASQCELPDCGPAQDVSFVGATPSGSTAFLVTAEKLTDDDADAYADLYGYDAASGALTLLSAPAGVDVAVTIDPVRASADGSRVYFRAVPQPGPVWEEETGLYLADASGPHLVAAAARSFVQTSTDGRYALFATRAQLGDGDGDESVDAYRYDAAERTLTQVSAGAAGAGNGAFDVVILPEIPVRSASSHPFRAISEDGRRIFFSSAERLLAADSNDAIDIYEWAGGSLGLISSGAGERPALYFGSSLDGGSAVFRTSATLVPRDRDGGDFDFYVARVGGGFAESTAPGCEGSSCREAPRGPLVRPVPESARAATRIRLRRIDPAARRQIAATGWIALLAEVPRPGRLSAEASARIGRRSRTIAATAIEVAAAGPARLRMRLSRAARQRLAQGGELRVRLALRLSGPGAERVVRFELEGRP